MTSFATATTVEEALAALAQGAKAVAGGTDLVVGARQGKASLPDALVAIHRVSELHAIDETADSLRLGALVTHAEIAAHPAIRERFTALADASAIVGSHATRAQGTIGGNVMNASPAMETGGPLICLGATATLRSVEGTRTVSVEELLTGPGATAASADELLVSVDLPAPAPGTGSAYVRLEYRRQMEIAVVGATTVVHLEDRRVQDARVAITALAPTIRRVPDAEAALAGGEADDESLAAAARKAAAASAPISDVRASERYRRAMAEVIARRAMEIAVARARGTVVPIPASGARP
ncbi:MAG TPA: FAD binding domain-containing protein [Gaiella sp.]|nr:FAD binding domain-containing protein [Gaiella sp.]